MQLLASFAASERKGPAHSTSESTSPAAGEESLAYDKGDWGESTLSLPRLSEPSVVAPEPVCPA